MPSCARPRSTRPSAYDLVTGRATAIDRVATAVALDSGEHIDYDTLVLATGARNRMLPRSRASRTRVLSAHARRSRGDPPASGRRAGCRGDRRRIHRPRSRGRRANSGQAGHGDRRASAARWRAWSRRGVGILPRPARGQGCRHPVERDASRDSRKGSAVGRKNPPPGGSGDRRHRSRAEHGAGDRGWFAGGERHYRRPVPANCRRAHFRDRRLRRMSQSVCRKLSCDWNRCKTPWIRRPVSPRRSWAMERPMRRYRGFGPISTISTCRWRACRWDSTRW